MTKDNSKQVARLKKGLEVPVVGKYFLFIMIVLGIVYICDELSSNITSTMQPYAIFELFKVPNADVLSKEYSLGVAKLAALTLPATGFMLLLPFYKTLPDRFGRKLFLIINTLGMGVGMLICMVAPNVIVYVIGVLLIQFMQPNDIQVIYIMETAPAKHRAKLCSITKAIALVSVSLLGVMRKLFYNPSVVSSWRLVYLVPCIITIGVALITIFLINETPVYAKKKLEELTGEKFEIEIEEEPVEEEPQPEEGKPSLGFIGAVKYIFASKQLKAIAAAAAFFYVSTIVTSYYSTVLEISNAKGLITSDVISNFMIYYPFFNGLVTFFSGFITDGLGRKKAVLILGVLATVGCFGFIFGAAIGANTLLLAGSYGVYIGGLWSVSDLLFIMLPAESTPTELRSSVIGAMALAGATGMISNIMMIVCMNVFSSDVVGPICLFICVPFMIIALVIVSLNVKETKGVDLSTIE